MLVVARELVPPARDSGAIGLVAMPNPSLTKLPNRLEWEERLAAAVERARTGPGRMLAVLFIDLDDFKRINDSDGHQVGDHVFAGGAQRLVASVRPADPATRYGGDEFVVLLDDVPSLRQVRRVARRICRAIKIPMERGEIVCSWRVGQRGREDWNRGKRFGARINRRRRSGDVSSQGLLAASRDNRIPGFCTQRDPPDLSRSDAVPDGRAAHARGVAEYDC